MESSGAICSPSHRGRPSTEEIKGHTQREAEQKGEGKGEGEMERERERECTLTTLFET